MLASHRRALAPGAAVGRERPCPAPRAAAHLFGRRGARAAVAVAAAAPEAAAAASAPAPASQYRRQPDLPGIAGDITQLVGNTPMVYLNRIGKGLPARIAAKVRERGERRRPSLSRGRLFCLLFCLRALPSRRRRARQRRHRLWARGSRGPPRAAHRAPSRAFAPPPLSPDPRRIGPDRPNPPPPKRATDRPTPQTSKTNQPDTNNGTRSSRSWSPAARSRTASAAP